MNVALLLSCSSFEGFFGGVQRQTRESYLKSYRGDWSWYYATGLLAHGIKPVLYIPSMVEEGRYETDCGVSVRFLPLGRWYRPMENFWFKRLVRQLPLTLYADERANAMAFMTPLRDALACDGIDLLYVQEYWSGRFDHLVPRLKVPVVAADHGGLSDRVIKLFKPRAFASVPLVYSQTDDECRIVQRYGGRARLHPNGCDTAFFSPEPELQRQKTILTVARLTNKQKRTSDLIRALALLPKDWRLEIVGTGPDQTMLQALATQLNVADRVQFAGFLSRNDVRRNLQSCGVFAMPSSNEAIAIAALEAMSSGASVVLSRIRAFERLIVDGQNGRLVDVGDTQKLSEAIVDAWHHREARGAAARATVCQNFDSRVLSRELAQSLRHAAATSAHSAPDLPKSAPAEVRNA